MSGSRDNHGDRRREAGTGRRGTGDRNSSHGRGASRDGGRPRGERGADQPRRNNRAAGDSGHRRGSEDKRPDYRGKPRREERGQRPRFSKEGEKRGGFKKPGSREHRDDRRQGERRQGDRGERQRFDRDRPRRTSERNGSGRPATRKPVERNEEREKKPVAPALPEDIDADTLPAEVRRELRSLPKSLADLIASHLAAAGMLVDSEPEQALEHARFARQRAARVGVVRETNGITAYHSGEWSEALAELRAARRLSGGPGELAIMADCERALGRPERALELTRSPEAAELTGQEAIELRIVAAGARRDRGEIEASVVSLQIPELDPRQQEPWSARLFYAYADNLLAAGRVEEAFTWFVHAAHADDFEETDAPDRLDELVARLGGEDKAAELVAEAESVTEDGSGDEEAEDSDGDTA